MTASRRAAGAIVAGALAVLGGCTLNRQQSALEPGGPQAAHLERLWWFAFWVSVAVWVLTIAALLFATFHRRRARGPLDPGATIPDPEPATERRSLRWVVGATGGTVAILLAFLVVDLLTGRALAAIERREALTVRVTGYQWWWRVEYRDTVPSRVVVTANELHVPVGRPVMIEAMSGDVIHSFWVPSLHGKRDLVPGLKNRLWIQADRPGIYRGECAEFCGHQHAKMAFVVVAESQERFDAWYASQLRDATPPTDALRAQGLAVFESRACAMCHQIRGTRAGGQVAPDLTHLASRRTLAAGTLPNTRGHLAGWIVDPQSIKPGTRMPANNLEPGELRALLAYLEGLR
ncbi:MAG: cytochrome c oxidase subunit II [Gemmatirosa sp.]